ncbi:MAG: Na+:solute symporter [Sedimentisphaerales bacterium]|nr:Na+:solute symporter [Sedimentisphaerales bacterium]
MTLHSVDIFIIIGYMVSVVLVGLWVSKRAGKNINSYFLGENSIPYYLLGVANATGMFDVSGTMWMVTLLVLYGVKSIWIPWLWPCFNQIFLMVYLSVWLRRSGVMTGAEWIEIRFGRNMGTRLSHISVVIFALISVIGFQAYAFKGIGKFIEPLLPWDWTPNTYALVIMGITTVYTIAGGMYSVVITDLIQFVIMTLSGIFVAWIAMTQVAPEQLANAVPAGWHNLFFGWKLDLDWTGILSAGNAQIAKDGYSLFGIFFTLMLFKGLLASLAGPAPNYDMQRILSTRTPREASLMSWFTNVALFLPRYLLIGGIGVLGIVFFREQLNTMGDKVDFEQIMPLVLNKYMPVGVLGIMLAGLLSAFMSTFNCTLNAGASYIVRDIYQRYMNPKAAPRKLIWLSYTSSILIVIVGVLFGYMTDSINSILQWIVAGLYGGYIAPNVLKWHWWRFNGYGYFAGMVGGMAGSLVMPKLFPDMEQMHAFLVIFVLSSLVSVVVSLMTRPEEMGVLKEFYKRTRPWGFWGPVCEQVLAEDPDFRPNRAFGRDMVNVAVGIVWQVSMCAIPIYMIIRQWNGFWISVGVLAVTSLFLKWNWYHKLEQD